MGVDYLGLIYIDGGVSEEALAELVGPDGSHLVALVRGRPSKDWLAIDVHDRLLDQGIDEELLQMLRGWSARLGQRVAVLERADSDFELVLLDGGTTLRHLHFHGGIWSRVTGDPQPWEKVFFERADWTDSEEHGAETPEGRAISLERLVQGSTFPDGVSSWVEDAGFPRDPTHDLAGGGPSAGELAADVFKTAAVALAVLLTLALGTGLFAALLGQCGIFDG